MPPRIDERYPYLASEEKHKRISSYLDIAFDTRPNSKLLDKERLIQIYGYDILTLAMLSDSPITAPLVKNFDEVLNSAWRFLNKVWEMRLEFTKTKIEIIKKENHNTPPHKIIAQAHSLVKKLHKDFGINEYQDLLNMLYPMVPNFVCEIQEFVNKK